MPPRRLDIEKPPDQHIGTAPAAVPEALEDMMRTARIPGLSIAVVGRDGVHWAAGLGRARLDTDTRATAGTSYPWFSMSKIVTATATLKLADTGMLHLDAAAADYAPSLRGATVRPTVRQLLDHTAGLPNPLPIRWAHAAGSPPGDPDAALRKALHRRPGSRRRSDGRARYSNLGYLALGEVITAVAGMPFTRYVEQEVFAPAGMSRTGFVHRTPALAATGYLRAPRIADPLVRRVLPEGVVGGREGRFLALNEFYVDGPSYGGVVGDVVDAGRFLRLHLNDGHLDGTTILRRDTARAMRELNRPGSPFDHGLGWFRRPTAGADDRVEHFGAGVGFWNVMRLYPGRGIGVVLMANTTRTYAFEPVFELIASTPWRTPPTVRHGLPEDAEALLDLTRRAIRQSAAGHYTTRQLEAWAGRRDLTRQRKILSDTTTLVAVDGAAVLGYVSIAITPTASLEAGEVDQLFVDPANSTGGVAGTLLAEAEELARAAGLTELSAHVSRRAQRVFTRAGYAERATETVDVDGEQLIRSFMTKSLGR